jgi:hypothetical protein
MLPFNLPELEVSGLALVTGIDDGTVETITGATIHPVWSVDRQEWVPLAELAQGERLKGLDGLAVVLSVSLSRVTSRSTISKPTASRSTKSDWQIAEMEKAGATDCVVAIKHSTEGINKLASSVMENTKHGGPGIRYQLLQQIPPGTHRLR